MGLNLLGQVETFVFWFLGLRSLLRAALLRPRGAARRRLAGLGRAAALGRQPAAQLRGAQLVLRRWA